MSATQCTEKIHASTRYQQYQKEIEKVDERTTYGSRVIGGRLTPRAGERRELVAFTEKRESRQNPLRISDTPRTRSLLCVKFVTALLAPAVAYIFMRHPLDHRGEYLELFAKARRVVSR